MRIGIIGAGKVGLALGVALAEAGHDVVAASTATREGRKLLAHRLPTAAAMLPPEVAHKTDLVLIAVPDDALAAVITSVAEAGAFHEGQVVIHTSGAHGIGVLAPAAAMGAAPMALHPAMTFTGTAQDVARLADGVCFGATVPDSLRPLATRIVADLGGEVAWVEESARPLYHAALVHGANHLVTLVNEAMEMLRRTGVTRPELLVAPLLRAVLENALKDGDAALTGPVARGDAGTIARHVATVTEQAPDSLPAYLALARRTADRAIAAGRLTATDAEPLLGVLAAPAIRQWARPPRTRRA